MSVWLARPYRTDRLDAVREAIDAGAAGDVTPLQALYREATAELAALDPDEVADHQGTHRKAGRDDEAALRAATRSADLWEAVVSVGATIVDPARFRAFAWLAAHVRYDLSPAGRDLAGFRAYARGRDLPDTSPEDSALYAALPALLGLGPEFPDEIAEPCPLEGRLVGTILGLPGEEWDDVDPLDGVAISAGTCRAHYSGLAGAWRDVVGRSLEHGMLVRRG